MEVTRPRSLPRPLPAVARRPSRALRQLQIGGWLWYGGLLLYGGALSVMVHGPLRSSTAGQLAIGMLLIGGAWPAGAVLQIDSLTRIARARS